MAVDNAPVIAAAKASALMKFDWRDRDVAPHGYIKGMAVAFAETYRLLGAHDSAVVEATKPRMNDAVHDVLDHYAPELAASGATAITATDRLISVFTVMIGLGMRESSGRHCEGPDTPEDRGSKRHPIPTTPENAEAGLFQVSYDSIANHADRQALVDAYRKRTDLIDVFGEGAHCVKPGEWPADVGDGPPAAFQNQMKSCPLFAALYTAMFLRQALRHWGPIKRKEAEIRPEAVKLFSSIRSIVDNEHVTI